MTIFDAGDHFAMRDRGAVRRAVDDVVVVRDDGLWGSARFLGIGNRAVDGVRTIQCVAGRHAHVIAREKNLPGGKWRPFTPRVISRRAKPRA
ncbi:MAG TPA: hypothetical protein VGS96_05250 [Thermoanaerobaculia bacterium]|jgi:hypothetical protein|nr:hypothetical protein [Thermoanaerobaculia bacterium]